MYFQAWTNTYGTVDELKAVYDAALDVMPFCELIVSTRPDQIDDEKAALLASYRNKVSRVWVELGLQSGNDATLSGSIGGTPSPSICRRPGSSIPMVFPSAPM